MIHMIMFTRCFDLELVCTKKAHKENMKFGWDFHVYVDISYLQGAILAYPGNDNTPPPPKSKGLRGKKCQWCINLKESVLYHLKRASALSP